MNRKIESSIAVRFLLTFIWVFFAGMISAQNNPFKIHDSLYPLFLQCNKTQGTPAGLDACEKMYKQATEIHDTKAQCIALVQKAKHYSKCRPLDMSGYLKAIDDCKKFSIKTPYKQYYFNAWVSLIIYYINHEDYSNAMKEVKAFQKDAVQLKNDYGIAESYRQLGHIFFMLSLYDQSILQYQKCLDYFVSHGNERQSYEMYYNIASCYYHKGNNKEGEANALAYIDKCPADHLKVMGYVAILSYLPNTADKKRAKQYFNSMQSLFHQHGLGRATHDSYYTACSRYYAIMGDLTKAIIYSDSIENKDLGSRTISYNYSAAGNFKQAYDCLNNYLQRRDSINTVKVAQTIAMYTAQFGLDQLEMEHKQLELENKQIVLENERQIFWANRGRDSIKLENQALRLQEEQQRHTSDSLRYAKERERQILINDAQQQKIIFISVIGTILLISFGGYTLYSMNYSRHLKKEKILTEKALELSRRAEKFQTMFLNNMSHEIRTPLNAIVGFTELLNSGTDLTQEERDDFMGLVSKNSELLTTLVNDLLDLSRMQSGNYKLCLKESSATELCVQACGTVSSRVPDGVELRFDRAPGLETFTFITDYNRVTQVLVNFLTNACKFTTAGSIALTYTLKEDTIEFSVSDTGVGVSPDKAKDIFNRFEKLDEFKQGTGLGLNICTTIASLLHGKVWLDTDYKKGARFVLSLPLHPDNRS